MTASLAFAASNETVGPGADPRVLIARSQATMQSDPEQSRRYAEQALVVLDAKPDPNLQTLAHWLLCDYQADRDRAAAEDHLAKARALLPSVTRPGLRAGLLACEGGIRELAGDTVQASALYEQAVTVAEQAHDDEMLADALFERGYLRGVRGEYANGLVDLRRALQLYEKLNMAPQARTIENSIATAYARMGDSAAARRYLEAAIAAERAGGLLREEAVTQNNLGRALESLQEWEAAQEAYSRTLALCREIGYPRGIAYALRGLAAVRNALNAPNDALKLLDDATRLSLGAPDERLRAQILMQRAAALRKLRRPAEAAFALNEAVEILRKADSPAELSTAHGDLAATLSDMGDWRNAYDHEVTFKSISDEMLRRQLDQRFATLRIEYDSAAKDKENEILQREKAATEMALAQEHRASQFRAIVIALAALLVAILGALVWRHRRTSRRMHTLAMTDELTGLPNRRHVLGRLDALLSRGDPCALMIADLDRFKPINDEYGHLIGDEILRTVAEVLRDCGREPVELGRLGGEEFLVVLPSSGLDGALVVAERLREKVAALDVSRWLPDRGISISLGATAAVPGDTASSMLHRADDALYEAKRAGRNLVVARSADESSVARVREPAEIAGAQPA